MGGFAPVLRLGRVTHCLVLPCCLVDLVCCLINLALLPYGAARCNSASLAVIDLACQWAWVCVELLSTILPSTWPIPELAALCLGVSCLVTLNLGTPRARARGGGRAPRGRRRARAGTRAWHPGSVLPAPSLAGDGGWRSTAGRC